jgi:predicted DCC family thiol-disulfide oxidoreductase YuxK
LCFPWPLLYALIVVPRSLRDTVHNLIARHRYG